MQTTSFKSLFPTLIKSGNLNESFLDSVILDFNRSSENFFPAKRYEISSNESGWKVEIPLPGICKEDIKISTEEDKLKVEVLKETRWNINKIFSFKLPSSSDYSSIEAKIENGILTLNVQKKKSYQNRVIEIK